MRAWLPGPLRRIWIRSTALRLHGEGGIERVFRWLDESGVTVEELRRAFWDSPFALRLIDDHLGLPAPPAPEPPASGVSAFERAVDEHLAAARHCTIYERYRSNLLASQPYVDMLAWFTRYRPIVAARALDDGCGTGGLLVTSQEHGAKTVVGIELDPAMVRLSRVRANGRRAVHCLRATGESLPLRSATFDVAFSSHVIEHVADQRRYMAEIARVLRPGGTLFLACPNRLWPKEQHSNLRYLTYLPSALARRLARFLYALNMGSREWLERLQIATAVAHFVSPFTVRRLARGAGLRVVVLNPTERFVAVWPGIAHRLRRLGWPTGAAAFLFSPELLAVLEKPSAPGD